VYIRECIGVHTIQYIGAYTPNIGECVFEYMLFIEEHVFIYGMTWIYTKILKRWNRGTYLLNSAYAFIKRREFSPIY